ncbi:MAG: PilZ domain-containing protein [Myxococcota bacterium]
MDADGGDERRFERERIRIPGSVHCGGETLRGFVSNLSATGLFLETRSPAPPAGQDVRVELVRSENETFEILGRVARVVGGHRAAAPVARQGFGIALTSAPEAFYAWVAELGD